MIDPEFTAGLISTDIVVWNGVTSRWGCVQHFVSPGDLVRMADAQELFNYYKKQNDDPNKKEIIP